MSTIEVGNKIIRTECKDCVHYCVCKIKCRYDGWICEQINCKPGFVAMTAICEKFIDSGETPEPEPTDYITANEAQALIDAALLSYPTLDETTNIVKSELTNYSTTEEINTAIQNAITDFTTIDDLQEYLQSLNLVEIPYTLAENVTLLTGGVYRIGKYGFMIFRLSVDVVTSGEPLLLTLSENYTGGVAQTVPGITGSSEALRIILSPPNRVTYTSKITSNQIGFSCFFSIS